MSHAPRPADPASVHELASRVGQSAQILAHQSGPKRNNALAEIAAALRARTEPILQANVDDLDNARQAGLDEAFVDRLKLSEARIEAMAANVEEIAALDDPVGRLEASWVRPNGLRVGRRRIPLGVIGMIYESRPNVTSDAAALCVKSANGVLLKGGSAALSSNRAVYQAIQSGLQASRLPDSANQAVGFVDTADRSAVGAMLELPDDLDVIIPRGGKGLIDLVTERSRIPVIKHREGICHVVVDGTAPPDKADAIVLNAKTDRPGVCNAMETLLVHRNAVDSHLGRLLESLSDADVMLHLCDVSHAVAKRIGLAESRFDRADRGHYGTEFLSLELAVRVVEDLQAAIDHIGAYGSHHTEALVTDNYTQSQQFQREVDSAVVMINASTRFSDGNQLGLGAEIGISTTKLHAYGPMGVDALTTTKFIVLGDGQVRR